LPAGGGGNEQKPLPVARSWLPGRQASAREAPGKVLIVDDDAGGYSEALAENLPACRFTLEACPEAARRYFLSTPLDLVLLCHSNRICCLDWLPFSKSQRPSVTVIVVTVRGSEELAIQSFWHVGIDYFRKPFDLDELQTSIWAALEIRRRCSEGGTPQLPTGLQRSLRCLESSFNAPVRLDDVACGAGMSVSCFARYLKKQTGMSFTVYLNSMRVARARELLRPSFDSMLQIALACGFCTSRASTGCSGRSQPSRQEFAAENTYSSPLRFFHLGPSSSVRLLWRCSTRAG